MGTNPVDDLGLALEATGGIVGRIRPDQWGLPTPCEEWSVADVVRHLTQGHLLFAAAVEQRPAPPPDAEGAEGADRADAYGRSTELLLRAFGRPGALDEVVTVPFGTVPGIVAVHLRITEALVHGWDLARATGQPAAFPERLAEQEMAFTRSRLSDVPAGRRPFAPPQPAPDDAPAINRLAALLGRSIGTTPGER